MTRKRETLADKIAALLGKETGFSALFTYPMAVKVIWMVREHDRRAALSESRDGK